VALILLSSYPLVRLNHVEQEEIPKVIIVPPIGVGPMKNILCQGIGSVMMIATETMTSRVEGSDSSSPVKFVLLLSG